MPKNAQVEAVKDLLDQLLTTDLPRLNSGLRQLNVPLFRYGIKDVSISISVGAVELSLSLGGEDEPREKEDEPREKQVSAGSTSSV